MKFSLFLHYMDSNNIPDHGNSIPSPPTFADHGNSIPSPPTFAVSVDGNSMHFHGLETIIYL